MLYFIEAAVALLMQSHVQGAGSAHKLENITMIMVDGGGPVHTRSVQSHYNLELALLAMQPSDKIHERDWRP